MNAPAARGFAEEGAYLEILVDPSCQALKLNPCNDPGAGRYRIFKQSGASIQVRRKLLKFGVEYGIYLNVGGSVFQHIDHVS